jgi:large conductance mechanosensitive channel
MSVIREFKQFIARGNVIDLAVAVVLGGAFGKIVTAFVEGVIMPIVGAILPGGDWRTFAVSPLRIQIGAVIGASLDFLLIALTVFLVVHKLRGALQRKPAAETAPSTRPCPECLEPIPVAARRCRACAQPVS